METTPSGRSLPAPPAAAAAAAKPARGMPGDGRERFDATAVQLPATQLAALLPELKWMTGLVSAAVLIAALYFGRDILMPLALAFLLGFVLEPLVSRLKRWGVPRTAAVVLVVVAAIASIGGAGLFIGQQVSAISAELPTYQTNIRTKLRAFGEYMKAPGMFDGAIQTFDAVRREVENEPTGAPGRAAAPRTAGERERVTAPTRVQVVEPPPSPLAKVAAWFEASSGPLANAGIALVFVVLVLLDRLDLRDRVLRLWGGSLHRSTDAMDEAGHRISKYLTMQLVVNLTYGVPMAVGLWLIGVPGALLWGALAALMRFVPYLGPMISAIFPVALAFAVDPGWSMLFWTLGLILLLELVSNNVIEPWLYGASTGLSAMSLMVAATFWTALWGPVGLIISTPLTVCLMVIGRHLPRLAFLDVLLGSQPALDTPTRIYQRLLAGEAEEATELVAERAEAGDATGFYDEVGLAVLRMATSDHASVATSEHRHRVVTGMEALLDEMLERHPAAEAPGRPDVVAIGGKWEIDNLAARMLAHALALTGQASTYRAAGAVSGDYVAGLDLDGVRVVCLSYFSAEPQIAARHFCRRLRRRWPETQIVLALWNAPPELLGEAGAKSLGADAVVGSIAESVLRSAQLCGVELGEGFTEAPIPIEDTARLAALRRSGALDPRAQPIFDAAAKRAADVFDLPMALVSLIDETAQDVRGAFGALPSADGRVAGSMEGLNLPRELSICGHVVARAQTLVVPDIAKDLRFAGNPALRSKGVRFYAGAPLRDEQGQVLGTLCLLDVEPRTLAKRDLRLLEAMADELMTVLRTTVAQWGEVVAEPVQDVVTPASAIVGQPLPSGAG